MTDRKDDGGPAFPAQPRYETPQGHFIEHAQSGMTLRDWFAGNAPPMPDWFVPVEHIGQAPKGTIFPFDNSDGLSHKDVFALENAARIEYCKWLALAEAAWRFFYADAMIEARK